VTSCSSGKYRLHKYSRRGQFPHPRDRRAPRRCWPPDSLAVRRWHGQHEGSWASHISIAQLGIQTALAHGSKIITEDCTRKVGCWVLAAPDNPAVSVHVTTCLPLSVEHFQSAPQSQRPVIHQNVLLDDDIVSRLTIWRESAVRCHLCLLIFCTFRSRTCLPVVDSCNRPTKTGPSQAMPPLPPASRDGGGESACVFRSSSRKSGRSVIFHDVMQFVCCRVAAVLALAHRETQQLPPSEPLPSSIVSALRGTATPYVTECPALLVVLARLQSALLVRSSEPIGHHFFLRVWGERY
jgi:hypothetical protein